MTNKNELVESVEMLEAAQIDLDQVTEKIRQAVRGTSAESTADAYTIPGLSMISHEEGHGYIGREMGNLDALIREIEEVIEEMNTADIEKPEAAEERVMAAGLAVTNGGPKKEQDPDEVSSGMEEAEAEFMSRGTELDKSKQVNWDDQDPKVREVYLALTNEEIGILRVAASGFDGHPGVDSGTIAYYKPDFLALALLKSVDDHVKTLGGEGSKGMTSKGLTITLDILEKFEKARFPGVCVGDLAHVEMERDDEKGREAYMADLPVIDGGAE